MPSPEGVAAAGAEQWLALSDALLAGLVHAVNNRVTALSVCAELAQLGDTQMMTDGMLASEVARLQSATALIALLPSRPHAADAEALELRPVLEDAIALHAHHPRTRSIACRIDAGRFMQPVRAPRWALLRLLLIFVEEGKSAAPATDAATVRLASDERSAWVRVRTGGDGGAYGAAMATLCGGALAREGDDLVLELPSLLRLRERERAPRGAP